MFIKFIFLVFLSIFIRNNYIWNSLQRDYLFGNHEIHPFISFKYHLISESHNQLNSTWLILLNHQVLLLLNYYFLSYHFIFWDQWKNMAPHHWNLEGKDGDSAWIDIYSIFNEDNLNNFQVFAISSFEWFN